MMQDNTVSVLYLFLAPTGAQEVTMYVRPFGGKLSRAVNIHHSGSYFQAISQE